VTQPNRDPVQPIPITRLAAPAEPADVFRITVLCTGNRFRSPIAAAVIETLTEGLPIDVRSMGTKHVGSVGAMPEAIDAAARLGIDVTGHVARLATASDVAHADLVLGFELSHLARARQLGAPAEHAFTLPDLAAAVEELSYDSLPPAGPVARARAIVARAHERRRAAGRPLREIRDPASTDAHRALQIARDVHLHASTVVGYLFENAARPAPGTGGGRGYPA